ncbi:MAG: flagellar hook-length control protein FliK, partial [Desulfobacteraceae bacterium]
MGTVPCIGTRASNNVDKEEQAKETLSNLLLRLEDSGIPAGGLRLPGSAAPVVAGLLEEKGFSSPEIDQVLKSIKDEEGLLMLDKLMARLGVEGIKKKDSLSGLSISRSDIPRVQEMLVKMELGPSEVKEAVEKSTDRAGVLSLDRLTGALRGLFQDIGPDTTRRLANLLEEEMGVQVRRDSLDKILEKAGLENPGARLSRAAQEGAGYEIKKEIADLLREKDIQPQEIKRFLESLEAKENVTQGRGKASAESLTLLQKQEQNAPSEGWKARILEILHKEGLNSPSGKQGPEVENGSLKNRSAEILEKVIGDEKGRAQQQQPSERDLLTALRTRAGETGADKGRSSTPTGSGVEGRIGTEDVSGGKPFHWGEGYVQRTERTFSIEPGSRPGASASPLPEPLPKIVDRLAWMVKAGEQHARVHVSPPDLGRLDLDLVIKNGHLHAHLSAENHAVKELLEANLQQLR